MKSENFILKTFSRRAVAIAVLFFVIALGGILWRSKTARDVTLKTPTPQQMAKVFSKDSRDILLHNDRIILYSLDIDGFWRSQKRSESFEGYPVFGYVEITDAQTKSALLASFLDGVARGNAQTLCFNPRHGLRAIRNGKTVDFVICFHCVQMQVFDGKTENPPYVSISNTPKQFFNDLLTRNHIEIAAAQN